MNYIKDYLLSHHLCLHKVRTKQGRMHAQVSKGTCNYQCFDATKVQQPIKPFDRVNYTFTEIQMLLFY